MNNRGFFLQEKDAQDVWHPFDVPGAQNIVIKKARGVYLYDTQNRKYLDMVSSWWVNMHGHGHQQLKNALNRQFRKADHVIFSGFTHEPAIRLAGALLKKTNQVFDKVFFSDNGSTAVEVAIKLGLQYFVQNGHKKITVLAFENAYHGDTFGAMSVGGRSIFTKPFDDFLFEVKHLPLPHAGNIDEIVSMIETAGQNTGALLFIYEPLIQGAGGMQVYAPQDLATVLAAVKKFPSVCIADEVMTGFYRTGTFTASEQITDKALTPDMMCLSKGITGGVMPLGATLITERFAKWFGQQKKEDWFYHGHSYTGNPLACAVAVENLKLFDKKTLDNIQFIEQMHKIFAAKLSEYKQVKNIRTCGTILRFEISSQEQSGYTHSQRDLIYQFFLENGVLVRPLGNVIYFMPPYSITKEQLQFAYKKTGAFLETVK